MKQNFNIEYLYCCLFHDGDASPKPCLGLRDAQESPKWGGDRAQRTDWKAEPVPQGTMHDTCVFKPGKEDRAVRLMSNT